MFFVKDLEYLVRLHPSYFNAEARAVVENKVYADVEGTNTGTMLIVAVISIDDVSDPKIQPGTGYALYTVAYRAIVWRPFRGEVVDGLVSSVLANGFLCDVGGLAVFVSKAMIDPRMKFSMEGSTPNFSDPSDVEGATLEQGSQVRLRIKGIRAEVGSMFAIGSIREDYLGALLQ